jgi:hypothetical protein
MVFTSAATAVAIILNLYPQSELYAQFLLLSQTAARPTQPAQIAAPNRKRGMTV